MIVKLRQQNFITIGITLVFVLVFYFLLVEPVYANPVADWIEESLSELVYNAALVLGGMVLVFGSLFLDWSIFLLVVQMGSLFQEGSAFGDAVNKTWTLLRDVINILFIYALIYLGIRTILNSQDSDTRRKLGLLIAAALLINFSLFITQIIVDFSNVIATQVYGQMIGTSEGTSMLRSMQPPIAEAFLNGIGISSWLDTNSVEVGAASSSQAITGQSESKIAELGFPKVFQLSIFIFIFFVLAGISFFFGALMILARFVALILYMVFSPIMFLGWILPKFQSYSDKWWSGFFKNAFFAPLYIFSLYIALQLFMGLVGSADARTTQFGNEFIKVELDAAFITMTLHFIVMIGLLWASLAIGDKLSVSGGKIAVSSFNSMGRSARGFAYRNSAGLGLNYLRKGYDGLDQAAEGGSRTAKVSRWMMGGEAGRRAVVKARDYGAGGTGWAESEKMNTERSARATRSNQISAAVTSGDLSKLTNAQIVELMESNPDAVKQHAGTLKPSHIKAIREEKDKLNDKQKQDFETFVSGARGAQTRDANAASDLLKRYQKDPSELGYDNLSSTEMVKHIMTDGHILDELGKTLSPGDKQKLKNRIMAEARGKGKESVKQLDKYFNDSRTWHLS